MAEVLKTSIPQGIVGSNPTLSAGTMKKYVLLVLVALYLLFGVRLYIQDYNAKKQISIVEQVEIIGPPPATSEPPMSSSQQVQLPYRDEISAAVYLILFWPFALMGQLIGR